VAIFGKTTNPADATQPDPERPAAKTAGEASTSGTVIGPKSRFSGEISGDEDVVVHGRLEGNIDVARKVTVVASGELKGDIHARSIVVGGRVDGEIRADERAELLASASVQGNVFAPKVVIAEGAQIQGSVAMSAATAQPPAPPPKKTEEE
jgi:cytoskeletal protein CcmA (bactofilin family)